MSQGVASLRFMTYGFHCPLDDPDQPLRARALRYVLLDELSRRPEMSVAAMVGLLTGYGFTFTGHPSKVISDALRWEVGHGRVTRLRRGVYRYRHAPSTTLRRVRILARRCRAYVTARRRGETPPPTPPNRRLDPYHPPQPAPIPPAVGPPRLALDDLNAPGDSPPIPGRAGRRHSPPPVWHS